MQPGFSAARRPSLLFEARRHVKLTSSFWLERLAKPGDHLHDIALFEAKNRLSELVNRVQAGEEIAITRRGEIVARLVASAHEDLGQRARDAIEGLRASRQGVSLGRLSSKDLIRDGQR